VLARMVRTEGPMCPSQTTGMMHTMLRSTARHVYRWDMPREMTEIVILRLCQSFHSNLG
jgi:hypothetical protein